MKKNLSILFIFALIICVVLSGCKSSEPKQEAKPAAEKEAGAASMSAACSAAWDPRM